MDKYLLQILHDVNTIIIPGLGALTVTNKTTGDIMFMSFLKHDDGNLARYISEKEGMSENDAKNLIAKYVREIQAKLDSGDTYDMYQFGRFIKKDGEIDFESWNNYQHPAEESAPEEVKPQDLAAQTEPEPEPKATPAETTQPAPERKEEPKTEESEIAEANEVISDLLGASQPVEQSSSSLDDILNKEKEEKAPEKPAETPKAEDPKKEAKPAGEPLDAVQEPQDPPLEVISTSVEETPKLDVSEIQPSENVYIPEEEAKKIAEKQAQEKKSQPQKKAAEKKSKPIVTVQPVAGDKATEKKKKSPVFWVMLIVIVLLAAGGGLTAVFYKDIFGKSAAKTIEKEKMESSDENLEEIEKQVALESEEQAGEMENTATESQEEAKQEQPVQEEVVVEKTVKPVLSGDKSYHIIAGGFGVEANAERLAKKYQAEGKSASVLGKFNDLYLVSYEAYATQEEANAALKSSGIKGWIFKYPK